MLLHFTTNFLQSCGERILKIGRHKLVSIWHRYEQQRSDIFDTQCINVHDIQENRDISGIYQLSGKILRSKIMEVSLKRENFIASFTFGATPVFSRLLWVRWFSPVLSILPLPLINHH